MTDAATHTNTQRGKRKAERAWESDCNKRDNLYKCCIFITRSNGKKFATMPRILRQLQLPANECGSRQTEEIHMWSSRGLRRKARFHFLLHHYHHHPGAFSNPLRGRCRRVDHLSAANAGPGLRLHIHIHVHLQQSMCIRVTLYLSGICGSVGWLACVWISWTAEATPLELSQRQSPWGAWLWLWLWLWSQSWIWIWAGHLRVVTAAKWVKTSEKLPIAVCGSLGWAKPSHEWWPRWKSHSRTRCLW